ncbi:GntR family transcriptional regulator [Paenarthrobacter sp. AR 02]|uniref:FadR/GntR family transcriptional regulator n=1 Tax=Paenarthrobacter sp. AR 02 TaxID=2899821 RepID=UPI001F382EFF|nr:GntR family transcriptional regulator [Paenarthrobacter sp. AR 02]MCF3139506.1 GntR family transcriptional regulator [Paenarthrobacter sp. AR 02]
MAPPSPFESQIYRPLPEIERAEAIVDRISTAVALGLLNVGERLPAETALSEKFGVGGTTLREALTELRIRGTVETRRGRSGGSFVAGYPLYPADEMQAWFLSTSIPEIRDIGEEHIAISTAVVRLACERAEPQDFKRLHMLAGVLDGAASPEVRAAADSRFHIQLAVAARSPRLASAEIRLQQETVQQLWTPLGVQVDTATAAAEHLGLARAIARDQPGTAEALVQEHIRRNVFHLIDTKLTLEYAQSQQRD